jgi:threonylcarbamoyladenosine tRNA methylthiotransferase MtaB
MEDYTRAFLKVEDGCNRFCSYCIIPYVRGRVRSRRCGEILKEAAHFAARGYRELVLTGINLSAYGTDLPEEEAVRDLAALVRELDRTEGIERIRLGSLDPQIVTGDFLKTLSSLRTFCPHFHLSMQSGCDSTLRRMNRAYTTAEYREGVKLIRESFPDAAITTDVIVGFPGETEEEFLKTQDFIREIHFYETHIFPYSRREGTKAAEMPGQLTAAEKAARAEILAGINRERANAFREKRIGTREEVLTEEAFRFAGKNYLLGNTREYVKVAVPLAEEHRNKLVSGEISSFLTPDVLLMDKIIGIS